MLYIDFKISGVDVLCDRDKIPEGNDIGIRTTFSEDWASLDKYVTYRKHTVGGFSTGELKITSSTTDTTDVFYGADFVEIGFIGRDSERVLMSSHVIGVKLEKGAYIFDAGVKADDLSLSKAVSDLRSDVDGLGVDMGRLGEHGEKMAEKIEALEVPAQAEDGVTLQRLYEAGKVLLEDATFWGSSFVLSALSSNVTINAGGYTEFEFVSSGEFLVVSVDGSSVTSDMNGRFAYSGIVNDCIKIAGGPATVNVSRYSSSGIYTGGILSPELSEKLHKTSVFTSDEKKKLAETSVFTSAEKAIVNKVGAITDASVTTVRAFVPLLVANGIIKIDADSNTNIGNTGISGGNLATITVGAYCSFAVERNTSETTKVYVDGVEVPIRTTFSGYADVITITDDTSISLRISSMTVYTYKGGYITSEQLKDFDRIRTEINKLKVDYALVDATFNEIHEYAEEIIGGDSE